MIIQNLYLWNDLLFLVNEIFLVFILLTLFFFFAITKINLSNLKLINNVNYLITDKYSKLALISIMFFLFFVYDEFNMLFCNKECVYYIYNSFFKKTILINLFSLIITIFYFFYLLLQNFDFKSIKNQNFEYILMTFFSFLGSFLIFLMNDLLLFYFCFEIISLSIYVLLAFNIQSNSTIESVIKYYILGALSSALILLGIAFIYGTLGITNFNDFILLSSFINYKNSFLGKVIICFIFFILIAIFLKLGLFPFHFWLPQVYSGITYKSMLFLFLIPKNAFIFFFINFYFNVIYDLVPYITDILVILCFFSITIGTFGALAQKDIKKLLAYSSIVNLGYIIIILTNFSFYSIIYSIYYILCYAANLLNFFSIIFCLQKIQNYIEYNITNLSQLKILYKIKPILSFILLINIFSIAGLPPFGAFYAKYFILLEMVDTKAYFLVFLILIISILSSFYYIRIIKISFFDKIFTLSKNEIFIIQQNLISSSTKSLKYKMYLTYFLISFFFIFNILQCFYPFYILNIIINYII